MSEVKIRKLEWQGDGATWYAKSILGLYAAWNGYYRPPGERGGVNTGSAVDEAKAAAQAHFEAAVRSAILPDVSGAEAVAWRWDQVMNEGDWQTGFTEHGEPPPSPTVRNVTPLYSRPSAPVEKALARALDFIESLTADPLLMGLDDIEMTLEDVQAHARIELDSIRKQLHAEGK